MLSDLKPAGIMLRKRNFLQNEPYDAWRAEYAELLAEVRAAIGRPHIIVCVDHEGGGVHRFPEPITRFPYPAVYGSSLQAVESVSTAMARELYSLGVNISFSPVADIHSNPENPVINQRAFGTTASQVGEAASVCAAALRQGGVVPCAKHFPGHGDTATDSHFAVPVLAQTLTDLQQRELIPFQRLVNEGIEMVMSAHLMVPLVDPDNQATISHRILTELLRTQMGFRGITITDALGMKGILDVVMSGSFVSRAHHAGLDLFLMAGDVVTLRDSITLRDELVRNVNAGVIDDRSMASVQSRVVAFLAALPQYPVSTLSSEDITKHHELCATLAKNAPWKGFVFNPQGFV
jgi:beta-N-acetylhexosaminidase